MATEPSAWAELRRKAEALAKASDEDAQRRIAAIEGEFYARVEAIGLDNAVHELATALARSQELEGALTAAKQAHAICTNGQQIILDQLNGELRRAESAEAERDRLRAAVAALFGPAVDIAELSPAEWQRRVKVVKSALAAGAAPTTETT